MLAAAMSGAAAQTPSIEDRLRAVEAQNEALRQQLAEQRQIIEELKHSVAKPETVTDPAERDLATKSSGFNLGKVHLSGEGGLGFFTSGDNGPFPQSTFRVDEAELFIESPVWTDTYFYGELDVVTREAPDEYFHVGELYLDFENVLRHWTEEKWLSIRAGRMYIPFGEEYTARRVIDNPLISHSLTDLWGVDEGVELYGKAFGLDYVLAVQNGGHPTLKDYNGDKSVVGRIGYNFGNKARLSFSGMRTGEISVEGDKLSELWFGNGFFRNLGPADTTTTFQADLLELDAQTFWKTGHLKVAGGHFDYSDNDRTANNERDGYYYYAEAVQNLPAKFYTAARFSQILSDKGMPIVGQGDFGEYFYEDLTRNLWRMSIGLGYRFSDNLVAKVEYSHENGSVAASEETIHRNFFGAQLGFQF